MPLLNNINAANKAGSGIEQNIHNSFAQFSIGEDSEQSSETNILLYRIQILLKRLFDIVFAIFLLIVSLPVSLLISFMITLWSPGPVFISEKHVGKNGKDFPLWKFRTKYLEKHDNPSRKAIQDLIYNEDVKHEDVIAEYLLYVDRSLTPIGKFLQITSLDELPQLFNILTGHMSFVGPRPHQCYEVEEYKNWYKRRLNVKPGITSWSKLNIKMTPKNYEEAILYDLWYVDHWTLGLDLKILFKTVPLSL